MGACYEVLAHALPEVADSTDAADATHTASAASDSAEKTK
jgi:hypothetical protein